MPVFPQLERVLWFHEQSKAGCFPNAARLAEQYEVSQKTAQRDINLLRDRFRAPLEHETGRPISSCAHKLNGNATGKLNDSPAPADVLPALLRYKKSAIFVAHDARFNLTFLWFKFKRLSLGLPNRHHCTFKLGRKLYPHLSNNQFDTVNRYLFGAIDKTIIGGKQD